jgi:hypothetical protein
MCNGGTREADSTLNPRCAAGWHFDDFFADLKIQTSFHDEHQFIERMTVRLGRGMRGSTQLKVTIAASVRSAARLRFPSKIVCRGS